MKFLRLLLAIAILFNIPSANAVSAKTIGFTAEIWADNWFALYVNGKKVGEDSVPITTQKSFNSEIIKFTASYPMTIGFIAKDYVQSKSGLEYLGTSNQQIGDGGLIFQIRETTSKKIVAVSDASWKMKVGNTAPLNPECEKSTQPDSDCKYANFTVSTLWSSTAFNDSSWQSAKIFSANEVGPKDGYNSISWLSNAKFIWGNDLKLDNVVYFRKKISAALATATTLNFDFTVNGSNTGALNIDNTCDGASRSPEINWSAIPANGKSLILIMDTIPGPPRPGESQVGNHYYITIFNISPIQKGFKTGEISPYSPPCSQGPGLKEYRFFMYVLDKNLPDDQKADGAALMAIGEKESIAKAMHVFTYARKA